MSLRSLLYAVRTVAEDAFDRANSTTTLGSPPVGPPWVAVAGTWGINGNEAYSVSDATADMAVLPNVLPGGNGRVKVTMRGTLNSGVTYRVPQLLVRYLDSSNFLAARINNGNVELVRTQSGTPTVIQTAAQAMTDNTDFEIAVRCAGLSMIVEVNGTDKLTHTLSGGETVMAGYTGIGLRMIKNGSPTHAARWNNLEAV